MKCRAASSLSGRLCRVRPESPGGQFSSFHPHSSHAPRAEPLLITISSSTRINWGAPSCWSQKEPLTFVDHAEGMRKLFRFIM